MWTLRMAPLPRLTLRQNSVDGSKIEDGTVASADITDGTIATADLGADSVTSAKIVDGTVVKADLAGDSVDSSKIEDATVTGADITNGTIATADLGADSVTSSKIVDGAVAKVDLAADSVDGSKIEDGTVASADITNATIVNADIAADTITEAKLNVGNEPADGQVMSWDGSALSWADDGTGSIGVTSIAAGTGLTGTATTGAVALSVTNLGITTALLADDGVTIGKMATGTDGHYITYDSSGNPTTAAFPAIPDGDITGITTNAAGGLTGGADTGSPVLSLAINLLDLITGSDTVRGDLIHVFDGSDTTDPNKKITLRELAQAIFRAETVTMSANSVDGTEDYFYIVDGDHEEGTPRRFTWNSMRDLFRSNLISNDTPEPVGTGTVGTDNAFSRGDHVHGAGAATGITAVTGGTGITAATTSGTADVSITDGGVGTTQLSDDGVTLAKMEGGTDGEYITYDSSGNPMTTAFPPIPAASTANPTDVGTTTVGSGTGFSRGDHAHGGGGEDGDITSVAGGTGITVTGGDTGDATIAITDAGVGTTQLAGASVTEAKIAANNDPTDEYVLAWDNNGSRLEWVPAQNGNVGVKSDTSVTSVFTGGISMTNANRLYLPTSSWTWEEDAWYLVNFGPGGSVTDYGDYHWIWSEDVRSLTSTTANTAATTDNSLFVEAQGRARITCSGARPATVR